MKDLNTFFQMLSRIYVILNRKQRKQMIYIFVVLFIGAMFELLGVSAMLPFMEALLAPQSLMSRPIVANIIGFFGISGEKEVLFFITIVVVILYLTKNVFLSIASYVKAAYSNNTQREVSVTMFMSYMQRPYSFFLENDSGVVIRGLTSDAMGFYGVIYNGLNLLSEGLVILVISVYLVIVDFTLAMGVLTVGVMTMLLIILCVKKRISELALKYWDAVATTNKWAMEAVSGIKDIMIYNRREYFKNKYDEAYEICNRSNIKYTFFSALPERLIEAFCISGILVTVLIRINMGIDTSTFVPRLAVFAMAAFRLLPSISRTTGYITSFIYNRPMVDSTYENITSARKYINELEETTIITNEDDKCFESEIEIKDLEWKYPNSDKWILSGLCLSIKKGQIIGIIGESGAGKSTLADILLGLYKPLVGKITMDGVSINEIPNIWSRTVGYVPQSVYLMDSSIRNNITFGYDYGDDDKVWEALKKASLYQYVRNLPKGLNTVVGERGIKFSGGQRQRVAIARALYNNPQIMILDEATSALDSETENAVMDAIESLAGKVTLIIIAHRVTTLKKCDRIYEIIDGKAVEREKKSVIENK